MSYLFEQSHCGLITYAHAGVMRVVLRNLCGIDEATSSTVTKPYCCTFKYIPDAPDEMFLEEVLG